MHWGNSEIWLSVERKFPVLEPPERQVTTWELQRWAATWSSILSHQLAKGLYSYQEGCAQLPRSYQDKSKRIRSWEGAAGVMSSLKDGKKKPLKQPKKQAKEMDEEDMSFEQKEKKSIRNLRNWKQRPRGRAPRTLA